MREDQEPTRARGTRRGLLRGSLAAAAAVASVAIASREAEAKVQPKAVQYVENSTKPNQNCANCSNFVAPNQCKVVEGDVVATGWCLVWAKKKDE